MAAFRQPRLFARRTRVHVSPEQGDGKYAESSRDDRGDDDLRWHRCAPFSQEHDAEKSHNRFDLDQIQSDNLRPAQIVDRHQRRRRDDQRQHGDEAEPDASTGPRAPPQRSAADKRRDGSTGQSRAASRSSCAIPGRYDCVTNHRSHAFNQSGSRRTDDLCSAHQTLCLNQLWPQRPQLGEPRRCINCSQSQPVQ